RPGRPRRPRRPPAARRPRGPRASGGPARAARAAPRDLSDGMSRPGQLIGHNGRAGGEYSSSDGVVNTVDPRPARSSGSRSGSARRRRSSGTTGRRKRPPESRRAFRRLYLVSVSPRVWAVTLVVLTAILVADLVVVARRPREPALRESALWVTGYILLAVAFGLLISAGYGVAEGGKFFAG